MARLRRESSYRSYSHLRAGDDYRDFELVPEIGRVPQFDDALTREQRARADRLLDDLPIVSLHDHPVVYPADRSEVLEYNRMGRQHTGFQGLSRSRLDVVFDNLMDGMGCMTDGDPWVWEDVLHDLGTRLSDLAHQDDVVVAGSLADLARARAAGRLAIVFGMEGAGPIGTNLDRLDVLYGFGVRQLGIAYNTENALGYGMRDAVDHGLTPFGRRAVERMNRLGIAIDLSHSGDATSLDVVESSSVPVLITHAGARSVWDTVRMKPDEVIVACARRGGVIGIEAAPHTTLSESHPRHSLDSVMDHVRYCLDLVGPEHVAFGPDTLFGDHVALHEVFGFGAQQGKHPRQFPPVPYVAGLENPGECLPNIVGRLVKDGYDDETIALLVGGNVLRVLGEIWRA